MKHALFCLALTCVFMASARATEIAPGLVYLRPTATSTITVTKTLETASVVLDLRAATDEPTTSAVLAELKLLRIPRTRVLLVLVSPETPEMLRVLQPGRITIGRLSPDLKTDITVTTSAQADQKALAALAAGEAPEKLIIENANKPRYDESLLVSEYHTAPEDRSSPATAKKADADTDAAPAPTPVVDAVLQRAVQVYGGLVALKKIPAP